MTNSRISLRKVRSLSCYMDGFGGVADDALDWAEEDTELPSGNLHLWEESWDDDEQNDDFSKQLKWVIRVGNPDKPQY